MKFTQASNMGLHVMTYLVQQSTTHQNVSIKHLAQRFKVSPTYLSKILTRLTKAALITSVPGAKGGYRLAQTATSITFASVIAAIDGQPGFDDGIDGTGADCEIAATMRTAEENMWHELQTKRLVALKRI